MAEAFVQVVLDNLNSLIKEEIGLVLGVDEEMNKLASIFTTIQAVLEDAEMKQLESKPIQNWLIKLNDLTFEIDDVLDECATEVSKLKHRNGIPSRNILKKVLFRHKIARRMKQVTERLNAVAAEREKFHLREGHFERPSKVAAAARETGSLLKEANPVGREEEKEEIVDILVNRVRDNQKISVLPIVGIGGLGKTTLAQMIYNDPQVLEHFEIKLWVFVSENFDVKTLITAMIGSGTKEGSASDSMPLDALERRLRDLLNQKRYLLVLDDVWNGKQEEWSKLRSVLSCGSNGSSIIVTTRMTKVAEIMRTLQTKNLKSLSNEQCWMLLKQRAFREDEEQQYPNNLEAIGKQIAEKCGGVPLAAKALGGLLFFKRRTETEWDRIKKSPILDLPQDEAPILPVLKLSYHHLPLTLRQCFSYCAVFPKDSRISKKESIYRWMAHGYISSNGTSEVEDEGDRIWNELLVRSLFQNAEHSEEDTHFMMHDLVHDLAQSIMENKVPGTQLQRISTSESNIKIREVSLSEGYVAFPVRFQSKMEISSVLSKYSRLRVLDARWTIEDLPSTVGNMKHLRQLNLSGCEIRTLPDSLCSLWNLEILNLNFCQELVALPKNMRYLKNLRHLLLDGCPSLSETPPKIRELTSLKSLGVFVVGHGRGSQLEELQCLNLGGKLEIRYLERAKDPMDAKKANLVEKHNLRELSLDWELNDSDTDEKVLEALQPHPNLVGLEIRGFSGWHFPKWMKTSSLEKLVKIHIRNCQNLVGLSQLEVLPHLKRLELRNAAVEYFASGGNAVSVVFPSLESLELYNLPNLKGLLKDEAGEWFPNLRSLVVQNCQNLVGLPQLEVLPLLKRLELRNAAVEYFASGGNAVSVVFPSLESLELYNLPNLKGLLKDEAGEWFPNLRSLVVQRCQNLVGLPQLEVLPHAVSVVFPSLEHLRLCYLPSLKGLMRDEAGEWFPSLGSLFVKGCPSLVSAGLSSLKKLEEVECDSINLASFSMPDNLKFLSVTIDKKMMCIPRESLERLTKLEEMRIYGAHERCLPEEGLRVLNSLRSLSIRDSKTLTCLPGRWLCPLTTLTDIRISGCSELVELPEEIKYLHSLKSIQLIDLPKIVCLPEAIRHLTSLDMLGLEDLPQLISLPDWLGELTSLRTLLLFNCPKLASIPACIQRMANISLLHIVGCPDLERRCEEGKGEDWHKVAHIRSLIIWR